MTVLWQCDFVSYSRAQPVWGNGQNSCHERFIFRQHRVASHRCHSDENQGAAPVSGLHVPDCTASFLSWACPLLQATSLPPSAQPVCSYRLPSKSHIRCISFKMHHFSDGWFFFPPECVSCVQLVSLYIHLPLLSRVCMRRVPQPRWKGTA